MLWVQEWLKGFSAGMGRKECSCSRNCQASHCQRGLSQITEGRKCLITTQSEKRRGPRLHNRNEAEKAATEHCRTRAGSLMNTVLNSLWATACPSEDRNNASVQELMGGIKGQEASLTHRFYKQKCQQVLGEKERGKGVRELVTWAPATSLGLSQHLCYLFNPYNHCRTAEETEALERLADVLKGTWPCASGGEDPCQVSAWHHQSPCLPITPQENQWWARGFAGFWESERKEKHLSFQREKDQARREHIAFHKEKKSAFTAYVYTNIYFQGCIESNIIREKKQERLGLKIEWEICSTILQIKTKLPQVVIRS